MRHAIWLAVISGLVVLSSQVVAVQPSLVEDAPYNLLLEIPYDYHNDRQFLPGAVWRGIGWNSTGSQIMLANFHYIYVWDTRTLDLAYSLWHPPTGYFYSTYGIKWNQDETRLLVWYAKGLTVWDMTTGKRIFYRNMPIESSVSAWINNDSQILLPMDGGARESEMALFDANSGRLLDQRKIPLSFNLNTTYWSPDQKLLLTRYDGFRVNEIYVEDNQIQWRTVADLKHADGDYAFSAMWSPNQQFVVSSSNRGNIYLWDVENYELVRFASARVRNYKHFAWSSDSSLLAYVTNNNVQIWNIDELRDIQLDEILAETRVVDIVWRPNSHHLTITGEEIQIWDMDSGQLIYRLSKGFEPLWSPDGNRLLTYDGSYLRVWVIPFEGQCLIFDSIDLTQYFTSHIDSEEAGTIAAHQVREAIAKVAGDDDSIWWQLSDETWVTSDTIVPTGECSQIG